MQSLRKRRADKNGDDQSSETLLVAEPDMPTWTPAPSRDVARPSDDMNGHQVLGEFLVETSVISADQLKIGLAKQAADGGALGGLLVSLGFLDEPALIAALEGRAGHQVAHLREQTSEPAALALVPEQVARSRMALPLRLTESGVEIAVAHADDEVRRTLSEIAGRPVELLVAPRSQIVQALDRAYRALDDIGQYVSALQIPDRGQLATTAAEDVAAGESPVGQIVTRIITQALRDRASDIHLEPQDKVVRVRFRVDGALHDALELPSDIGPSVISRLKILADMNIVERRRPQDGQIAMIIDGREIDIRVATTATIWGECCVLRLLDKSRSLLRLDQLGMPVDTHEEFAKMVRAPFGMVLCAGPTGSGKTTTLYATLSEINRPNRNIMTIEDPVEYILPSINQIQTNEAIQVSFATGLRSILRQDPDIILVGEIRDVETARIAVQSALTGHFVLTSLHATDAVAALHRFLDMGIESFLIASSVVAIVGQRLVRRTCTYCKEPYSPTPEELAFYTESGGEAKDIWFAGIGCNFCSGTGYLDRVGVYELLRITSELRRLIVGWATQEELRRMAVSQGLRTLQDEALRLVVDDITTISEVMTAIYAF